MSFAVCQGHSAVQLEETCGRRKVGLHEQKCTRLRILSSALLLLTAPRTVRSTNTLEVLPHLAVPLQSPCCASAGMSCTGTEQQVFGGQATATAAVLAGLIADKLETGLGWTTVRVRRVMQSAATLGPALVLLPLIFGKDHVSVALAVTCLTSTLALQAFCYAGFHAYLQARSLPAASPAA